MKKIGILLVVLVAFAAIASSVSAAVVVGTTGNDTLNGTTKADILRGFRGNDLLYGDRGNDVLLGGLGNDILIATGPNGQPDGVDVVGCGLGKHDRAIVDKHDKVGVGCERVFIR